MEEATAPFKIQNVTLFEPLGSRSTSELLPALDRVWVRFRALGIPMVRLHSDRAKEMLAKPVRARAGRRGLYQTFTSGDDAPANGRIESEILQFKRRLRLTLQSSAAKTEEWPSVARHSSEERLRAQLQKVGLRQHAMLQRAGVGQNEALAQALHPGHGESVLPGHFEGTKSSDAPWMGGPN